MKSKKECRIFERARKVAEQTLRDPEKIRNVIDTALHMVGSASSSSPFGELTDKFQALIRLVRAYINRQYRVVPWQSVILAVAALIYFVNPFDALADFLPLVGFFDDAAVLTAVLASINQDLNEFLEWEKNAAQNSTEPIPRVVDADFEEVKEEAVDNG
ncbi:DUF1232 domain-containing protein [Chlorobaculum sp. MV4-Y]|jgi:uncharacterized membrane protein YkvA (DUF1232 family)|uniref:YkvA family protein n=1 Tax=Chlorobaculum sp. MV4-Y TaxID=2976335 RepID=UPI0021AE6A29|nr:DUF1232 domain-containing protein [Chlorobaculum sp. MV4-Y]UWX57577.1 DUF1232 domain-containing protein [Chlorobaculum sp. MV4-Y]